MKRLALLIVATLLTFGCALRLPAQSWVPVAFSLNQSSVMLGEEDGDGFCTAFAIDKEVYGTAAHCVVDQVAPGVLAEYRPWVNGIQSEIQWLNPEHDAAVLKIPGVERPILCYNREYLPVGTPFAFFGYALEDGLNQHFRTGVVSGFEQGFYLIDQAGIGGMSGGPVADLSGRVVSINQLSDRVRHHLGRPIADILDSGMDQYWSRECAR